MTVPTETTATEEDAMFDSEELLYRRYKAQFWVAGRFVDMGLPFPDPSFNRSKYSKPLDVLTDGDASFHEWGVLSCQVKEIPTNVEDGAGVAFDFFPRHDPQPQNRAHSVIAHRPRPPEKPPKTIRKKARIELGRRMKIQIAARS